MENARTEGEITSGNEYQGYEGQIWDFQDAPGELKQLSIKISNPEMLLAVLSKREQWVDSLLDEIGVKDAEKHSLTYGEKNIVVWIFSKRFDFIKEAMERNYYEKLK